jgi:hypothetical protein
MEICEPHINPSFDTGSIVACAYFGRCLEMGLHVTVYHAEKKIISSEMYVSIYIFIKILFCLIFHEWYK